MHYKIAYEDHKLKLIKLYIVDETGVIKDVILDNKSFIKFSKTFKKEVTAL